VHNLIFFPAAILRHASITVHFMYSVQCSKGMVENIQYMVSQSTFCKLWRLIRYFKIYEYFILIPTLRSHQFGNLPKDNWIKRLIYWAIYFRISQLKSESLEILQVTVPDKLSWVEKKSKSAHLERIKITGRWVLSRRQIHSPWLVDIVDPDKGLSYTGDSLWSLAGRNQLYPPSQGLWIWQYVSWRSAVYTV